MTTTMNGRETGQPRPKPPANKGITSKAMTASQARAFLTDAKYTIKTVELELFDNDGYVDDYTVTAREDSIEAA